MQVKYDNVMAHKIEAGSDIFLMPSRYEPCGLNQMYSLKYGTIPVVRATGGLEDTIDEQPSAAATDSSSGATIQMLCWMRYTVRWRPSAHTEADIERTIEAARESLKAIRSAHAQPAD